MTKVRIILIVSLFFSVSSKTTFFDKETTCLIAKTVAPYAVGALVAAAKPVAVQQCIQNKVGDLGLLVAASVSGGYIARNISYQCCDAKNPSAKRMMSAFVVGTVAAGVTALVQHSPVYTTFLLGTATSMFVLNATQTVAKTVVAYRV